MDSILLKNGYICDEAKGIWHRQDFDGIAYTDGDEVENRLLDIINNAGDLSVLSDELKPHCTDWPSLYHLSSSRANILRPFEDDLIGDVLEIGAGCGAITRYLGECDANVLALEGSPRRAMIARSRTRDLQNVMVLTERFEDFKLDKKFDVITLIGVLEYANLFTSSETPAITMLERVRSFLKPNGRLIIAIENQLGLKYFAGALEDHIGQSMYGIEGKYTKNQPQTYGRKVLSRMLNDTGFMSVDFLAPFPDYKLPVSIVSESGFNNEHFDSSAFAIQSVKKDPQLPNEPLFCQELVWPSLYANQLALDHSNSFLIYATLDSPLDDEVYDSSVLAWHYSVNRKHFFCKQTIFKINKQNHAIRIDYKKLSNSKRESSGLLKQKHVLNSEYVHGVPLSYDLASIVSKDDWSFSEIGNFLKQYLLTLKKIFKLNFDGVGASEINVPGDLIDATPQNIILDNAGQHCFFDEEWIWLEEITLGYLLFRSLILLIQTLSKFGRSSQLEELTEYNFIKLSFQEIGFSFSDELLRNYVSREAKLSYESSGISFSIDIFIEALNENYIYKNNKFQRLVNDYEKEVARASEEQESLWSSRLEQTVQEYEKEVARLGFLINEKDNALKAIFESSSWKLIGLLRFVSLAMRKIIQSKFFISLKLYLRLIRSALRLSFHGEWRQLFSKIIKFRAGLYKSRQLLLNQRVRSIGIIATNHTSFIANLFVKNLEDCGFDVYVYTSECPSNFDLD